MIKNSIKTAFLKVISGYSSESFSKANYIALAKYVDDNTFEEIPLTNGGEKTGYKRYSISGHLKTDGEDITNKDTLYFDEATADWPLPANYFVLTTNTFNPDEPSSVQNYHSNPAYVVAWGEIVDTYGNPKSIEVEKEQLPIIRANQLRISLSEVVRTKRTVYFKTAVDDDKTHDITHARFDNLYNIPALYKAERPGYVLDGWYTDRATTAGNEAVPGTTLVADTDLFAKWLYAVTFTFNIDGTLSTTTVGKGKTVSVAAPTKEGHTFAGWYKTSDFQEGTEFDLNTPIIADITLYAKFEVVTE